MKKKGFIMRLLGLIVLLATYIGLAFDFVIRLITSSSAVSSNTIQESINLDNFTNMLKSGLDKMGWYKASYVFMIITLVLVGIIIILSIVDAIMKNKIVTLVTKICSILGIVVSLTFFILFAVGGAVISSSTTLLGTTTSITYLPHAAPILITLFALLGSIFTLVALCLANKK